MKKKSTDLSYRTHKKKKNTFWNSHVQFGSRHPCFSYLVHSGEIRGHVQGKQWTLLPRNFSKLI